MKNIQVIDEALNCTYDIFEIDDVSFNKIFINNSDVEFEDDLLVRLGKSEISSILNALWSRRANKKTINGIHGTLFFGEWCQEKKPFYPTKMESEMANYKTVLENKRKKNK